MSTNKHKPFFKLLKEIYSKKFKLPLKNQLWIVEDWSIFTALKSFSLKYENNL